MSSIKVTNIKEGHEGYEIMISPISEEGRFIGRELPHYPQDTGAGGEDFDVGSMEVQAEELIIAGVRISPKRLKELKSGNTEILEHYIKEDENGTLQGLRNAHLEMVGRHGITEEVTDVKKFEPSSSFN